MSTSGSATWALISDTSNATIINAAAIASNSQQIASKAPLASPHFTGTPTAPTAAVDTNTLQLATTAFVHQLIRPNTGGGISIHPIPPGAPGAVVVTGTPVRVTLVGGGGGGGCACGGASGASSGTTEDQAKSGGGGGGGGGGVVVFWVIWDSNSHVGQGVVGNGGHAASGQGAGTGDATAGGPTTWAHKDGTTSTASGGHPGTNGGYDDNGLSAVTAPGLGGAGGMATSTYNGVWWSRGGAGQQGGSGGASTEASPNVYQQNFPGAGGAGAAGWRSSSVGAGGDGGFNIVEANGNVTIGNQKPGNNGTITFEWFS